MSSPIQVVRKETIAAVSANTTGDTIDCRYCMKNWSWEVIFDGAITALTVAFQLSDDNVNWYQVDTHNAITSYKRWITDYTARFARCVSTDENAAGTHQVFITGTHPST
ncbi:hypothetical protein LCGC14_3111610 [marine sediment metagenome]|uniref:Uncharacterized protein n=1 Tax=marine sediment metagenome TaxID=412755 RepID=A0A0F8W4X1_9ZZZZ